MARESRYHSSKVCIKVKYALEKEPIEAPKGTVDCSSRHHPISEINLTHRGEKRDGPNKYPRKRAGTKGLVTTLFSTIFTRVVGPGKRASTMPNRRRIAAYTCKGLATWK